MKKLYSLVLATGITLLGCQPAGTLYKDALCIEHVTIVDPSTGVKEDQTVIISQGKIQKISPSGELTLAKENEIIDGSGKFLIPGLWDAHVHFAYIEELAPVMFDLFLKYGITSVRDTGGEISFVRKWKDLSLANPTGAPRVMIAGPLLDGAPNVYDGSDPGHPPLSVKLSSVKEVEDEVHLLDSVGVDFLKAYEMLSPEQFAKVMELARARGMRVSGHVPLSMDVITASNLGLSSMEHMRNLELTCASNAEELLQQRKAYLKAGQHDPGGELRSKIHQAQRETAIHNYDETKANEVLQVLAKNQTWQIPTMALNTGQIERAFESEAWQSDFRYFPEQVAQSWKTRIEEMKATEPTPFNHEYTQWQMNMVSKINQAHIDIMAGTDCPIFFLTPGRSLHQELAMLVKSGLSPMEALKAATINPARYFKLEKELGSVQENYWADLVLLNANPLDDINNTLQIHTVIKQGKVYDMNKLKGRKE